MAGVAPGSRSPGPDLLPGTADDLYTIQGSGSDIGDEGDSFHFAYRKTSGDFSARARIAGRVFPPTGGRGGRYGLIVRRDCSTASKYSLVHANLEADPGPNPDHPRGDAVFWQFRRTHGLAASTDQSQRLVFPDPDGPAGPELVNQPNHFRLERRGRTFSGYASFDGRAWTFLGSDTWQDLDAGEALLVGIVYSKNASAPVPGTVTFTDFEVGPAARAETFDDDLALAPRLLYRSNFAAVPAGALPADVEGNCGSNCGPGGFTPQVQNGRLRLTQEGVFGSATSAFLETAPIPAGSGKIVVEFTVFMSHSGVTGRPVTGDPNPGEGITMAILTGSDLERVGAPAGGLGYEGLTRGSLAASGSSIAVEIDTWSGGGHNEGAGSPTADGAWHLGINHGGNVNSVAMTSSGLPDIFRPEGVRFRVEVTSEGLVSVFFPQAGGGQAIGPEEPALVAEVPPLSTDGSATGMVAFTGSTGDTGTQTGAVGDAQVSEQPCSDLPEVAVISGPSTGEVGSTVILDARGSSAGAGDDDPVSLEYRWSLQKGAGAVEVRDLEDGRFELKLQRKIEDGEVVVGVMVDDGQCSNPASVNHSLVVELPRNWLSYDFDGDGKLSITDAINDLTDQFLGGDDPPCAEAVDFDDSGKRNITDPILALSFMFMGGIPPARGAGCQAYPSCATGCNCGGSCP